MTNIEEKVIKTIFYAHKSPPFDENYVWVKKDNPELDVTMGSHEGADLH